MTQSARCRRSSDEVEVFEDILPEQYPGLRAARGRLSRNVPPKSTGRMYIKHHNVTIPHRAVDMGRTPSTPTASEACTVRADIQSNCPMSECTHKRDRPAVVNSVL